MDPKGPSVVGGRNGMLPNGLSCNEFPDTTLHYTWRAALNYSECTIIENGMN